MTNNSEDSKTKPLCYDREPVFLPTDKATNIFSRTDGILFTNFPASRQTGHSINSSVIGHFLHIVSDEPIKEGWNINTATNEVLYVKDVRQAIENVQNKYGEQVTKPIIATTDPELLWSENKPGILQIKTNIATISQPDIEYLISLHNHNRKGGVKVIEKEITEGDFEDILNALHDPELPLNEKDGAEECFRLAQQMVSQALNRKNKSVDVEKLADEYADKQGVNYPIPPEYQQMIKTQIATAYRDGLITRQSNDDKLQELLDWIETLLSAESKLGASDDIIKTLLSVKYKIESLSQPVNDDKKFGSPNWKLLVNFYMYLAENGRLKPRTSKFNNEDVDAFIKSITPKQMVEYEEKLVTDFSGNSSGGAINIQPKLKDGNIIIIR